MTSFAIEQKIHIDAPDAKAAFALERRLAHLHASAVCVHEQWAVELHSSEDQLDEIEAVVRHWLRDSGRHKAVIAVAGGQTTEVVRA